MRANLRFGEGCVDKVILMHKDRLYLKYSLAMRQKHQMLFLIKIFDDLFQLISVHKEKCVTNASAFRS